MLLATTPINAEITHIREDQVNGRPELIDITRAKINEFSRRFEVFRSEHAKIHAIHVDLGGRNGSGLTAAVNELIVTAQGISEDMESVYDFLSHISNENLTTAEKLGHINAKITEANTQSLTAFDNLLEISRDRQLLLTQLTKLEALETNSREFDVQFLEIIDGSDKTESATLQASSSALITQYNNSKSIAKTALTQVRSSLNHSMFETLPENVKLAHEITQNLLYLGSQNYKAIETELEAVRQLLWYDEHARPLLEELKREKQYGVTLIFSNR